MSVLRLPGSATALSVSGRWRRAARSRKMHSTIFFFQAEDGIRDKLVTGVQTCCSSDLEPIHIHVERDRQIAKFWLQPVSLAKNKGFRKHELDRITRLVLQYEEMFVEAWHDYFNP